MTSIIKNDLLTLKEKMEEIEKDMAVRLKEVEGKAQKYSEIDEKLKETKDRQIRINVGGKVFITKLSVLLSVKDTLFYNYMGTLIDSQKEIPKEIFFDRNYSLFPIVLDYLRYHQINLKSLNKFEREEIVDELDFYGIDFFKTKGKKLEYQVFWDQNASKSGVCTVSNSDERLINIYGNTCYTHYLTNHNFTDEDFVVEFESSVTKTDFYYYIGLINENYSTTSNCGCCNPANCYFIKCDGTVHTNGTNHNSNPSFYFQNTANTVIGMKVKLTERKIWFYVNCPENETGPYNIISGTRFKIYAGSCNGCNGQLKINTCYAI